MSLDFTNDRSMLVQVMAWCCQATSHYLSQCWPRSLTPYGVTRPEWVNGDSGGWICQIPPISPSLWLHAWLPMPVLPLIPLTDRAARALSLEIPRIAEDYHLSATPQLSRPLELHCMEQDYSQLYPLRMSTLTHWLLDTLRTYYPQLTYWGRNKIVEIFQTTFSNAFSWIYEFRSRFH